MATPDRLQLVKFGALVAELRRKLAPAVSQADLGRKLVENMPPGETANYDQTFVAKLEKGLITNPSKEFMRALSKALDANYGQLLGALVADKYLAEDQQQIASFLNRGALTLQELAAWERREEHSEVWIVAEQLYDTDMPDLQDAVKSILTAGGSAVFFLNQENDFKFEGFRDEMAHAKGMAKVENLADKLVLIKLQPKQSAVLAAPFVIANPTKPEREGYIVLSDALGPSVAIKMSGLETHRRMDSLRALKSAYEREQRETK